MSLRSYTRAIYSWHFNLRIPRCLLFWFPSCVVSESIALPLISRWICYNFYLCYNFYFYFKLAKYTFSHANFTYSFLSILLSLSSSSGHLLPGKSRNERTCKIVWRINSIYCFSCYLCRMQHLLLIFFCFLFLL